MQAWINGKLVDESSAVLSIFDRSYLYGEGIFETLRCYGGKPAFLPRHYQRLAQNARRLEIPLPFSEDEFQRMTTELLEANRMEEAVIRITLSTVGAAFGVERPKNPHANVTLFCRPVTLDTKLFETGVKVFPSSLLTNDSPATADIKATSYLTKMLARAEAAGAGAYETLLKNARGNWAEGSRTNLFAVVEGTAVTPPVSEGILNGITRQVVLEILQEKKMPHREAPITDAMLKEAEEIFLTGSTSEVMPVCEVIGRKKYAVGPLSHQLLALYRRRLVN